jgi:Response regulator receiver domain
MQDSGLRVLIVDDEPMIRMLLSDALGARGYRMACAKDGFSALLQIEKEIPDFILSDLNMPGMSGFEFLSVVRCMYPSIRLIAMSGSFTGWGIPSGVDADSFYEKGAGLGSLVEMIQTVTSPEHEPFFRRGSAPAPVWIGSGQDAWSEQARATIVCPHCLRTFPQVRGDLDCAIHEDTCIHCHNLIRYAVA